MHAGARGLRQRRPHIGANIAPQLGLPGVGALQCSGFAPVVAQDVLPGFAGGPIPQPVGPVVLVTVQHIGYLQGQLVKLATLGVLTQVAGQRRINWVARRQSGQEPHQAPNQTVFVKGHVLRHCVGAQHVAVDLPQVAAGQLQPGGGTDAQGGVVGQRHFKPVLHAVALHQNHLGHQGWQGL